MGRIKRKKIRGYDEIKNYIKSNLAFVQVNNNIFDDIYEKGKITEADLIVFAFLQLINQNKLVLSKMEIAKYLKMSDKQIRTSIIKLGEIKSKTNARYHWIYGELREVDEQEAYLVNKKIHAAYNPVAQKNQKITHYYVDFIPPVKSAKSGEVKYHSYFNVHIDEFDLLHNGILNRKEFITYLFFNRINREKANKSIYITISKLSERLNIKLNQNTHKYVNKLIDLDLISEVRPANYNFKIDNGEEPSSSYTPIHNLALMNTVIERTSKKTAVNLEKTEVDFDDMEDVFKELEADY
ncbi:hypothetical protein [Alkalihalobacillus trypoxylicola]|uniref:Initiator Rep protein domain-containing protein n=1 Tax=Alkalihalobacillus trypoxylicola TaxID=519424 RepID=A0A162F6W3_9BACI|nr:hypothetical protein [Alkalihalobacillus trypoxylicola]KYG34928.1 hypothetical protein AZF04_00935 [Alkalihalobacillus trypoxylicola]